jgi:ABC-type branched-subunit amino acid transport system ATPase component
MMRLTVNGLSKRYGGLTVLRDIDVSVRTGEMRLIIGPNGAGKTTFLRTLMGFVRGDAGTITFDGARVDALPPHHRRRRGMVLVWQTPQPVPDLTVEENVLLGGTPDLGIFRSLFLHTYGDASRAAAREALVRVGLIERATRIARDLSHAERKLLEIGCGLVHQPKLLLLDEPTAGLSESEAARIGDLLLSLEPRPTMLIVAHDIAFARRLDASVMFLHEGRVLREGPIEKLEADPVVRDAYFGNS